MGGFEEAGEVKVYCLNHDVRIRGFKDLDRGVIFIEFNFVGGM